MSNKWESVICATHSGNLKEKEYEGDLDRVGALAFVPRLGSAYLRWTGGHSREDRHTLEVELIKAMLKLAKARRWRGPDQVFYRMVGMLLDELERPLCPACTGRGWVGVDRINPKADAGAARACPSCNGLRQKKFSINVRAATIKVTLDEWNTIWADRFELIRAALFKSCSVTHKELKLQLEAELPS